jgi:acyl carrier protein
LAAVPSQMPDSRWDHEAVLEEVRAVLIEVIGEDYLHEVPLTMDTSFENDLELESIEFVALAERLQERYPDINFVNWVADMQVDELMTLRLGQLVEFIARCQS